MTEFDAYQFGKYHIEAEIGRGGFGAVFRAVDTTLERPVALKILDPLLMRDSEWVMSFRKEARVTARLEHPHIVPIYEIGEETGRLFIAMKLIEGGNLAAHIQQKGALPWAESVRILKEVASALDFAHKQQVAHRDLKPGNILMGPGGCLLTDFGFARLMSDNSVSVSISGGVVGTPPYMAPEIWEGNENSGMRADIYALGCILYEMITGRVLFAGDTPPAIMLAHFKPLALPATWPAGVPSAVGDILPLALSREPVDRYSNAGAFARALDKLSPERLSGTQPLLETAVGTGEWDKALHLAGSKRAQNAQHLDVHRLEERAAPSRERAQWSVWARPQAWMIAAIAPILLCLLLGATATAAILRLSRSATPTTVPAPLIALLDTPTEPSRSPEVHTVGPTSDQQAALTITDTPVVLSNTPTVTPTPQPTFTSRASATPTRISTATPTRISTATPTRISTSTPTRVPASIPTLIPTPTATAMPETFIAFDSDRNGSLDIYLLNLATNEVRQLTQHGAQNFGPSWSPDGRKIAFVSDRDGRLQLYILDVASRISTRLTNHANTDLAPAWSPDGRWIAFRSGRENGYGLLLVDPVTGETIRLTEESGYGDEPAWSPDGRSIAYVSGLGGAAEIYSIEISSGRLTRLTENQAFDFAPAWSPDGRYIAFMSDRNGSVDIFRMGSDGRNAVRLTYGPAEDKYPTWSPDGRYLVFMSNRDGNFELYRMNSDGSDVRRLTHSQAQNQHPDVWRPAGN
jgi:eukaryotic-like serine/threonine-protein kinase